MHTRMCEPHKNRFRLVVHTRFLQILRSCVELASTKNVFTSKVASGVVFHSSSSLLICWAEIGRARSNSVSLGVLTNHGKKVRSSINGNHCFKSQFISFNAPWFKHGDLTSSVTSSLLGLVTDRATQQSNPTWQEWNPAKTHCGSHNCSTPKPYLPRDYELWKPWC